MGRIVFKQGEEVRLDDGTLFATFARDVRAGEPKWLISNWKFQGDAPKAGEPIPFALKKWLKDRGQ